MNSKLITPALVLLFCCLISTGFIGAEENPYKDVKSFTKTLDIPSQFGAVHRFNPATYLGYFSKEDLEKLLTKEGTFREPEKAKKLLLEANRVCYEKYKQTYSISDDIPFYVALLATFPELKAVPKESFTDTNKDYIYISDIARILQSKGD